jgi:hypothetical protein
MIKSLKNDGFPFTCRACRVFHGYSFLLDTAEYASILGECLRVRTAFAGTKRDDAGSSYPNTVGYDMFLCFGRPVLVTTLKGCFIRLSLRAGGLLEKFSAPVYEEQTGHWMLRRLDDFQNPDFGSLKAILTVVSWS